MTTRVESPPSPNPTKIQHNKRKRSGKDTRHTKKKKLNDNKVALYFEDRESMYNIPNHNHKEIILDKKPFVVPIYEKVNFLLDSNDENFNESSPLSENDINVDNQKERRNSNKNIDENWIIEEYIPIEGQNKESVVPKKKITRFNSFPNVSLPFNTPNMELPPWCKFGVNYHRLKSLHQEIIDFEEYMNAKSWENEMRMDIVNKIEKSAIKLWKNSRVEIFGSFYTNLHLPSSDIDLVVLNVPGRTPSILYDLAKVIRDDNISNDIQIIPNAKVPIIKLIENSTKCKVDVSFNIENGQENSNIISKFMDEYAPLRPLSIVLKYFLQQRSLNETYIGGLGSYALILMITSYLQRERKLRGDSYEKDFGLLLLGFFKFYGKEFNYFTTGISLLKGGFYYKKISRNKLSDERPYLLSIEDPQDKENDVGKSSYNILNIKRSFEFAYERLSRNSLKEYKYSPTYLNRIVYDDPSFSFYRKKVEEMYCKEI
jgi:non-canonical poly(A) RNA polymerase PAPD5/7